ncbi:hypothetical protein B0H14DRAFT_2790483 [Mycena olivaceomarginata]|nr:hypothetical protein B0H14DRAFT_2790483 [Mycena olivaceomarginata]
MLWILSATLVMMAVTCVSNCPIPHISASVSWGRPNIKRNKNQARACYDRTVGTGKPMYAGISRCGAAYGYSTR